MIPANALYTGVLRVINSFGYARTKTDKYEPLVTR